jgi:hypothetical protein
VGVWQEAWQKAETRNFEIIIKLLVEHFIMKLNTMTNFVGKMFDNCKLACLYKNDLLLR